MALSNKDTLQYYKINYDECKIKGDKIYTNFFVYITEREREKEKLRYESQVTFYQNLQNFISDLQKRVDDQIVAYGINPYEINCNYSNIPSDVLGRLENESNIVNKYREIEHVVPHKFYIINVDTSISIDIGNELSNLIEMGFLMEWVNDPIRMCSSIEVCCGDYNGEKIEPALFYNKMKTVIIEPLVDC